MALSSGVFTVDRFIGRGCYSMVYKVTKQTGLDKGCSYALKRFFIENESAYHCVRREREILERLAILEHQCAFLPIMYYSFIDKDVFSFIVWEGCGRDLYDLIRHAGRLTESDARFYLNEVICALDHVHSLEIVHLDIKPENILLRFDGHVFLSDFDRSYDLTKQTGKPTLDDFTGTPLFMAPEIAKADVITTKADIWSLAVLTAEMVSGPIRPNVKHTEDEFRLAREGRYTIRGFKSLSKPLQSFFTACLQRQHVNRPDVSAVKQLRFLKYVNWANVHNGVLKPPYEPSVIKRRAAKEDRCSVSSTDERLLLGAFSQTRPLNLDSRQARKANASLAQQDGQSACAVAETSGLKPTENRVLCEKLIANLKVGFTFINKLVSTAENSFEEETSLFEKLSILDEEMELRKKLPEEESEYRRRRNVSAGD